MRVDNMVAPPLTYPRPVSVTMCGARESDRDIRYIEVKGHNATGDVTLYYTEWQMAHRMREEYFIYEVDHALTNPEMRIVQDPVGKGIEPVERVVEYHIDADQLRAAALDIDRTRPKHDQTPQASY